MPHFFVNSNIFKDNSVTIADKDNYNHIVKSLRAKIGENLLLIDENRIQYECKIVEITQNTLEAKVIKSYKSNRCLGFKLYLAQSPLRSDAQSLIVEKATELGIDGIYPIFTDNCVLKKNVIEQKIQKWQKIMFEASKQCERAYVPTCFELSTIENLIKGVGFDKVWAFTERDAKYKLKDYLKENRLSESNLENEKILVIIGPEGGFSNREFEFFAQNEITTLSLGDLILKAETAVIVALGNIIYEYE